MRIQKSNMEVTLEPVVLEGCVDEDIQPEQIQALREQDVSVSKGLARIAGAKVRFTHLVPPNPTDEVPIGIVNGFCGTETAYKQLAVELALQGREVFYKRPPRTQTPFMAMSFEHIRDVLRLQSQATWGVMRAIREYTGHEDYDLYGHSMGTPIAVKAAIHKPNNVRSVILAGGAGLNGKNTFGGMLRKTVDVAKNDVGQGRRDLVKYVDPAVIAIDTLHHVFRRPDRTLREGFTVARIDARDNVSQLHSAGVKVGAILFDKDGFFKVTEVIASSGHLFDETLITPNSTHLYPQDHPVEHAKDVADMSQRLNWQITSGQVVA